MSASERLGDLLRELAPQVLGVLLRRPHHRRGGAGVPCAGGDHGAAIRVTRMVHRFLPDDGEVAGLLALMLLTDAGLELLQSLDSDPRIARRHRLYAVRAHLQELAGDCVAARENYRLAARRTTSLPEQRYLRDRADKQVQDHDVLM